MKTPAVFVQGSTGVEHNFDVARRCGHLLITSKWVINMARRCRHLLVMPKLFIKLITNEHVCSFSRVVGWW
jgi:hypothetical protein